MADELWVYAGEQLSELTADNLLKTAKVAAFLRQSKSTIVLSAKGMGKTHLLRAKRHALANDRALVLPFGTASDVDRVRRFPPNLPQGFWDDIDEDEWAALWELAIACAIILNITLDLSEEDTRDRLKDLSAASLLPRRIRALFESKLAGKSTRAATPSYIINEFLLLEQSDRKMLLRDVANLFVIFYRNYVRSAVNVFIDSVDQALSEADFGNHQLWIYGQTGLARAAYDMQVNNGHIKIYTSIRQEAWAAFTNENKESIEAYTVTLSYTFQDLSKMIDMLASYYHGKGHTLRSVLRLPRQGSVRNVGVARMKGIVHEPLFQYLHRHSLGTPRSLLHIINAIVYQDDENLSPKERERAVRHETNSKAGYVAQTKIDSEMAPFLECLGNDYLKQGFLYAIDKNVLSKNDLHRIVGKVVGLSKDHHPFCELYNIGLLGVVRRNSDNELIQHFKSPNDFNWRLSSVLPDSPYYLVHPALEGLLSQTSRLEIERDIVIGPGLNWQAAWTSQIDAATLQVFISYAWADRALREVVTNSLQSYMANEGIRSRIWYFEDGIAGGESIEKKIGQQFSTTNVMICLVTENYTKSSWCMNEFEAMSTIQRQDETGKRRLMPFIFETGRRQSLGAFYQMINMPEIDHNDAASLSKIGETIRRFWSS